MISVTVTLTTTLYAFALVLVSHVRRRSEADGILGDARASGETSPVPAVGGGAPVAGAEEASLPDAARGCEPLGLASRCAALADAHGLTAREREILTYLAEGHNGSYIASALFISPNTARTHIHNIYRKLNISSREDILRLTREPRP